MRWLCPGYSSRVQPLVPQKRSLAQAMVPNTSGMLTVACWSGANLW